MFNMKHFAVATGAIATVATVAVVAYKKGVNDGVEHVLQVLAEKNLIHEQAQPTAEAAK